ncbi:hypothetical protein [Xanthomonas phage X1]|nr:hypothetical protein [Xanthomonas phage X1]
MSLSYTHSERTVKKYTVNQACTSARYRLEKSGLTSLCTNSISGRSGSELITLEELNKIADAIVDDTFMYDGHKARRR